jgi:ankyrin repeat protein
VVQALLVRGADVDAKSTFKFNAGTTALMLAARGGHFEIVQALLGKGADVNAKDSEGSGVLNTTSDARVKSLLVQAGAKP